MADVENAPRLGCAEAVDRGLPQHTDYELHEKRPSLAVSSMSHLTKDEQTLIRTLDSDGDGQLSMSEVIAGVKEQSRAQHEVRSMRRRNLLMVGVAVLAGTVFFALALAANWQSKLLFLSRQSGDFMSLMTSDDEIVAVSAAKVAVPLGLAPFLSPEQLRDMEIIRYYDCAYEEDVWDRVLTAARYAPGEYEDDDDAAIAEVEVSDTESYRLTLLLASGRELVIDSNGEFLEFPEENVTQELCGELQCAQLHLGESDVAALEQRASLAFGSDSAGRRLGRRGGRCRRCRGGKPAGRRRRGRGGGRFPKPSPAPSPPPPPPSPPPPPPPAACSAVLAGESAQQTAAAAAAASLCHLFSGSRGLALSDLLGGIVRLSFHDAGSFDGATGGADGCVDLESTENRGLTDTIAELAPIAESAAPHLSRADVWALAGAMAIEFAGGPPLSFSAGRVDSDDCAGHGARHPDAEQGHAHISDVFVGRLGFSEREVAALMGAHVLGRAQVANSGYDGAWVPQSATFSNRFFRDLLLVPWNRRQLANFEGSSRTQWNGPQATMMLNTDIEMAFDTDSCTTAGGRGGGGGQRCPRADHGFSDAVTEFSTDQAAFFDTFAVAYNRLVSLGGDGALTCVFADCSAPGPL